MHARQLAHRDVKPHNVLVVRPEHNVLRGTTSVFEEEDEDEGGGGGDGGPGGGGDAELVRGWRVRVRVRVRAAGVREGGQRARGPRLAAAAGLRPAAPQLGGRPVLRCCAADPPSIKHPPPPRRRTQDDADAAERGEPPSRFPIGGGGGSGSPYRQQRPGRRRRGRRRRYGAVLMDFGSARPAAAVVTNRADALALQEDAEVRQGTDGSCEPVCMLYINPSV
jgi:serine/threonine protein kinase